MKKRFALCLLVFTALSAKSWAQAPNRSFRTLQLGFSPREAALGGRVTAIEDSDLNLALFTPSLASQRLHNHLSFNYLNFLGDINGGQIGYAYALKDKPYVITGGIRYFNYGEFGATNEFFQQTGTFQANEILLQGGITWVLDSNLRAGGQVKWVQSSLESYRSSAVMADFSMTYYNEKRLFGATVMVSNAGAILQDYAGLEGRLPFDLSVGLSKKLARSPLRFSLVADQLTQWDLSYTDPSTAGQLDPLTGQISAPERPGFGDRLFRHIYGGTELVFSKNFHIRFGYNYRRRQELKIDARPRGSGISYGFGMRIKRFEFSYARAIYHLAGSSHHFSITTNLATFGKK
ncbi:MAG TPA: type IX secretion system protein PorQ [Luteibaculaceae bacterium]|nr:type IX secretion system protein PorQ [Luteibaculaceae bacterium]